MGLRICIFSKFPGDDGSDLVHYIQGAIDYVRYKYNENRATLFTFDLKFLRFFFSDKIIRQGCMY